MNMTFEKAKEVGLSSATAVDFMKYSVDAQGNIKLDIKATEQALAQDAALITTPNVNVPSALVTYIDPQVVTILFSSMNTTKMFRETKKGSWTDKSFQFGVEEYTGGVTAYSDFADNVTSDANTEWIERGNFVFQTVLSYGELEEANAGRAKLSLASQKQRSASLNIAKAHNNINLYGVAGRNIYGMLNDPNLNAAVTPNVVTVGGSNYTTWADKLQYDAANIGNHVYNDISKLWGELAAKNGGNVDQNAEIKLGISNSIAHFLNIPNSFGLTAMAMLKSNYPNLTVVQIPELTAGGVNTLYMEIPELYGVRTAEFAYTEKMAFGRVVAELSSYKQKVRGGSCGFILKRPSLIARMTGV
ncbi:MAG: hypothetical protein U0M60_11490 [Clostridia bacterium]|jgi:hypothetical protein|nr:hypothetical protein [Clostridia bacterium]